MTTPPPTRGVLILAGGRGERFWPWSTPKRPKQLLPLASGGRTLLRATYDRACRLAAPEHVVVMTSEALVDACRAECPGAIVVGEPVMRNTAPAIAAAAAFFDDAHAFAVLPADHAIDDEAAFTDDLARAFQVAEKDAVLVTFGIPPTSPDTNFGYVRRGAKLAERLHRVAQFTEKPDRARAEQYVTSGEYAWNSGMFVWTRRAFLNALTAGRPAIAEALAPLRFGAATSARSSRRCASGLPRWSRCRWTTPCSRCRRTWSRSRRRSTGTISARGARGLAGSSATSAATCGSATRSWWTATAAWSWATAAPPLRWDCATRWSCT